MTTALETSLGGMPLKLKTRYGNFVAGEWMEPLSKTYFENTTPITGKVLCEIPRSNAADIDRSPVVWARDLSAQENRELVEYFRGRKVWLVDPNIEPARITPYSSAAN